MEGYIKLHRKLLDWKWSDEPNTFCLFAHILLLANFKPNTWHGIDIEVGQLITSIEHLSKQTGLTQRSIRTSINRLKTTGELTIKTTNKYTLITVVNWALYQSSENETTSKTTSTLTNERQTNDKQTTTTKEREECKNEKKSIYGEFGKVKLTEIEYQKLVDKFGLTDAKKRIEGLDEYIASKGSKYSSHYATILSWFRKEESNLQYQKPKQTSVAERYRDVSEIMKEREVK